MTLDEEGLRELAAIRTRKGRQAHLSLAKFVEDFGSGLMEAVRTQNPPIFTGETKPEREALLAGLKRKLFSAQAKAVHAAATLLCDHDEKSAIINGEMGVGKTTIGIATAVLLHAEGYPRALILSPPHLVYKWRREILDTVPQAEVVILNGADTIETIAGVTSKCFTKAEKPGFLYSGQSSVTAGASLACGGSTATGDDDIADAAGKSGSRSESSYVSRRQRLASCPQCSALVKSALGTPLLVEHMPTDRKKSCQSCGSPLWTQIHPHRGNDDASESSWPVLKTLCQLPGIGEKLARKLIARFGERFLERCLSDNVQQFVQLMDEQGEFIFSDKQAEKLSRALARTEITLGQSGYQASEYIKRYLPKGFFSLLIADEAHDYKSAHSAQGQAMGVLADQVKKIVLLTGTLNGWLCG